MSLNDLEHFKAPIENRDHSEWSEQQDRDAWNAEFPDDPIEE